MYIDGVIIFSLIIIALIIWMMGYVGLYFYRHIKSDAAKEERESKKAKKDGPRNKGDFLEV